MLGATVTESLTDEISVPPNHKKAFTENGQRDWRTGWELIRTCVATHDTATQVAYVFIRHILTLLQETGTRDSALQNPNRRHRRCN